MNMAKWTRVAATVGMALLGFSGLPSQAADSFTAALPTSRTHFSTAEPVEVAALYRNEGSQAKFATLVVTHSDGSELRFTLPLEEVAAGGAQTRLVTLPPGTMKPGDYTARIEEAGPAPVDVPRFSVYPSEHKNGYRTGQWVHQGGTIPNAVAKGGWMYMNTDYVSMHPRKPGPNDIAEGYVAASMKPFALMVCGGGHQLDLDLPNDWGDPWVQRAVAWRCQLAALSNRIYPIAGLHLFDEPGLTWWPIPGPDGKSLGSSPFAIPHQLDEFRRNTGKEMPFGTFAETLPTCAGMMDDWLKFMDMRMKYLGQCWYASVWGTQAVAPQFPILNQVSSSYAPHDVTDGVDSRQNKPYEILSGHGQYSDLPYGTLQPLRAAESYQGFSWDKPHIYLPMWYIHTWATMRAAVWISWASKLEGMLYPPDPDASLNGNNSGNYYATDTFFEMAEINRRLALVGGVMSQLRKSLAPVAVLQSHNQVSWDIATYNSPALTTFGSPPYFSRHREAVNACFFRTLETGMIPNVVDEAEAVEKGAAFLKPWKVIFCPALAYATQPFRKVLEDYLAGGGKLVQFKEDKLQLPGAVVADHTYGIGAEYYQKEIVVHTEAANKATQAKDLATAAAERAKAARAGTDLAWRQWTMAGAPDFAKDLAGWLGPQPFTTANPAVLLGVHSAGDAHYLLLANNAQSRENPRGIKHELIPAETTVTVPPGGVVYDLFNGGAVKLVNSTFTVSLAAGDGACFLYLPAAVGKPVVKATIDTGHELTVTLTWGTAGYLPFRLRIFDPSGAVAGDYYRATTPAAEPLQRPKNAVTTFRHSFPLGANATPGRWLVQVDEWLTGSTARDAVAARAARTAPVSVDLGKVSVYSDDAPRIRDLLVGKAQEPDWTQLNWDAKRVFGLEAKSFAVFATEKDTPAAERLAGILRDKGMTVAVNPACEIKDFVREKDRGGAGPTFRQANFENIRAHTIVLPGHALLQKSFARGHLNRAETSAFPGAGRAYVQWGMGCYQMGFQNVFVLGSTESGVDWLLQVLEGALPARRSVDALAKMAPATRAPARLPRAFRVDSTIATGDSVTGIGASPDGTMTYAALYDGSVAAFDSKGKRVWTRTVLLEATALAVSPRGDRVAVGGYPGLVVLHAADGKELGGVRVPPKTVGNWACVNRIVSVAWNDAGTRVAGGWVNNHQDWDPQEAIVLDADGKALPHPKGIPGNVYGVAFVPGTDTLLVGADKLTAVNCTDGTILWATDIAGAQAFAFDRDGLTAAAGGWGKKAGTLSLKDGKLITAVTVDAVVGGVAFSGRGELIVAVWGGTKPLFVVRSVTEKAADGKETTAMKAVPFFRSRFAFQNVLWSQKLNALVAAEQGGTLWLLGADGSVQATLDEDAGTTPYRLLENNGSLLLARLNRAVQRVSLKP